MAKKIDYASLYTLRSDGRYCATYKDHHGKRKFLYDRNPETLHFRLQAIEQDKRAPATFAEIAEVWHDELWETIPDGTKACYTAHYNRALARFGSMEASQITSHDIDTHLRALKALGLSASTISKQKVVYKLIFQRAIVDEFYGKNIRINPADAVRLPKGLPKPKKREAPEDEVVQKIQQCAATAYFGSFALFLLCTGMRRGEALAIRWQDIDFEKGTISVNYSVSLRGSRGVITAPKTESGVRTVPILSPLEPLLQPPTTAKPTDFVFCGENPALPMPKSAYDRKWRHYCKEMGFVAEDGSLTLTAHCLRHGYATMLYEAGIDEKEAAELMGHADEEMLRQVYTHLRNRKKAKAADRLREYTKSGLVVL